MKTGYVVPHTHWDREWRYPLWENRMYLVRLMDELLEILETQPDYKSFLMDGQTVAIRDYLLVRPEKEEQLKKFIAQGRIQIGPWYTLPDLYPVSGESLVRNLLKGKKTAAEFGKRLDVAYESFGWGQTAQFPQIYQGFGIDTVVVAKNVDAARAPESEFIWRGADGTEVLATRLGKDARANFFMNAYLQIMNGMDYKGGDYRYRIHKQGMVFHQANPEGFHNDYFSLESSERLHKDLIVEAVLKAWSMTDSSVLADDRILMDGSDSTTAQPHLVQLIAEANRLLEEQNVDIRLKMSDLTEYIDILKKIPWDSLRTVEGELRDGPTTSLSGNALMTRPHIKILNKSVQNKLFRCAEPFSMVADTLGYSYDTGFLNKAVDYLLLSHPHDSINGVTQDKTVEDVLYRLNQAREIAETVYHTCCQEIMKRIDTSGFASDDQLLVLFNPLPQARNEILKVYVDTPQEQTVWDFDFEDAQGNTCLTQFVSREELVCPVSDLYARPWPLYGDRHCIYLETGEIPAGGYKVLRLKKKNGFMREAVFWPLTRKTKGDELAQTPTIMENACLRVEVCGDGTLNILDKQSGRHYRNLNYFQDEGDCGDYWMYYPPYNNRTYSSKGCAASIYLEDNGPLSATIAAELVMELPAYGYRPDNGIKGKSGRSEETVPVKIVVRYTLKKDARQVDVSLQVHNTAKDHRMKVLFDTGITAKQAAAEGHFNVDHRPLVPLRDENGAFYNELMTQPMQNFVDLSDGHQGFGIISNSMLEYEAIPNKEGTLGLTLFRAVRNIICTEMRSAGVFPHEDGGQLLRLLTYDYAICLHDGDYEEGKLYQQADRLNVPVLAVQTTRQLNCGTLSATGSFFEVPAGLELSCLKKAEDAEGWILRLYNPGKTTVSGRVRLPAAIRWAEEVRLDETGSTAIEHDGNTFLVSAEPNKIKTYRIQM